MLQKISLTGIFVALGSAVFSQDTTNVFPPVFKLSGSVDAYYRFNFQNPKADNFNNLTSFTNSQNSFEFGMASIKAEHSIGKVGVLADLGFGRRTEEFSYNDTKTLQIIKQAYITYTPSSHVKFTIGKWATHIGYELLDASGNRNYSMSYMFTNGPFFHTGIRTDFTFGKSGFMIGIANPTDYSTTTSPTKTVIAQFSTGSKDDKIKAFLNYQGYFGASGAIPHAANLNQINLVVNAAVSSAFTIGYDGTVQYVDDKVDHKTKKWWGSALYLNYDATSVFGLTWRNEYFRDKDGIKIGTNVFASTLSANFRIDNFTIIPEIRVDSAKDEIFSKSTGETTKTTQNFILAAVYHF